MDSHSLDLRRYSHLRQRTAKKLDARYIATASIDKNNPAAVVSISPNVGGRYEIVSYSSLFHGPGQQQFISYPSGKYDGKQAGVARLLEVRR